MGNIVKKHISISQIVSRVVTIIVAIFIIAGIGFTEQGEPVFYGCKPVVVVSGSMVPTIQINSLTIVKYCTLEDIEVGDIVMYYHPQLKINITHRAIDKYENSNGELCIITKGDANESSDGIEVTNDLIRGKMVKIFNGAVPIMNLIVSNEGINRQAFAILIATFALALVSIISIINYICKYIVAFILASGIIKNNKIKEELNETVRCYNKLANSSDTLVVDNRDKFSTIFAKIGIIKRLKDEEKIVSELKQLTNIVDKDTNSNKKIKK